MTNNLIKLTIMLNKSSLNKRINKIVKLKVEINREELTNVVKV